MNLMGATKRIMELLIHDMHRTPVSSCRFANVAFSDGSLLHGFERARKGTTNLGTFKHNKVFYDP